MTVRLQLDNRHAYIRGASPKTIRALEKLTSYYVSGFYHSPAFKARRWDGKEHLMKFSPKRGYRVPVGLVDDVVAYLKEKKKRYKVISHRTFHGPKVEYDWNPDITLRPYQKEAVNAICSGKKWQQGSGLLKMPIRSGKTKTIAGVIRELRRRTLFIVPSQNLLYQSKESLEESLMRDVGAIGDGSWDIKDVTVATVQTLAKQAGGVRKKGGRKMTIPPTEKFTKLSNFFDVVVFDESHHLVGDVWHTMVMGLDCRYKIGLSATIFLDNAKENERGVIWLKACCGNVRYEVGTSTLIELGYLMQPTVELVRCEEPKGFESWKWCQELSNELIYENEHRNKLILKTAQTKLDEGLNVLIVSNRINQLARLNEMFVDANIPHAVVIGRDNRASRKDKVRAFVERDINVLMGTVFGEGVDIPEIECVINAEGGKDIKATVQRMRNLTPSDDKVEAIFVDFVDTTHKYFAKHSLERVKVYRSEHAFKVKLI